MNIVGLFFSASLVVSIPVSADGDAENGELLYEIYCTQCHGMDASGGGINVSDMSVHPRDQTDPGEMGARTDEELAKAVKQGGTAIDKSVLMPAWGDNFNDDQVADLVAYMRWLCCE